MTTMGTITSPRERELRGHDTRRLTLPMQNDSNAGPNPSGLCMCGCGQTTSVATQNDKRAGLLKGQHRRFLKSHHLVGIPRTDAIKKQLSQAHKGKAMGGENHRWKGGRLLRRGRLYLLVGADHPMAGPSGYVAEYRLVAAAVIGRYLETDEDVHHIDLDATNNVPDNLVVLSRSQHMRVHRLIRDCGLTPTDALDAVLGEET